jgi:hypothetical protein
MLSRLFSLLERQSLVRLMHVCKWRYAKREASRASVLKYALIYVILIEFTRVDMVKLTPMQLLRAQAVEINSQR